MHRALPILGAGLVALAISAVSPARAQSLRGSRASVDRMYDQAVRHDLHFYETAGGVRRAVAAGKFVPLQGGADYELKDVSQPYVLPATRTFVERLARQYRSACGERLVITSGTRPRSMRLANAASRSVHPTGMAVDLRRPPAGPCLTWLRDLLSDLEAAGLLEATEEKRPPHFHVAVYPRPYTRYVQGRGDGVRVASSPQQAPAADGRRYQVRRGDSLWTIARRNDVSVEVLRQANALRSSRIVAGQVLLIPSR